MIAVTHPDRSGRPGDEPLEQLAPLNSDVRPAVFPAVGGDDTAAAQLREHLHSVAESENRYPDAKQLGLSRRDSVAIDGCWSAGQDDSFRLPALDPSDIAGGRMDLAVYVLFPDAPGNQLGELRTKIDDENAIRMIHGCSSAKGAAISSRNRSVNRSRGRTIAQRPFSTRTSAARAREL